MMMAAAEVKPIETGPDMKSIKKPENKTIFFISSFKIVIWKNIFRDFGNANSFTRHWGVRIEEKHVEITLKKRLKESLNSN